MYYIPVFALLVGLAPALLVGDATDDVFPPTTFCFTHGAPNGRKEDIRFELENGDHFSSVWVSLNDTICNQLSAEKGTRWNALIRFEDDSVLALEPFTQGSSDSPTTMHLVAYPSDREYEYFPFDLVSRDFFEFWGQLLGTDKLAVNQQL